MEHEDAAALGLAAIGQEVALGRKEHGLARLPPGLRSCVAFSPRKWKSILCGIGTIGGGASLRCLFKLPKPA